MTDIPIADTNIKGLRWRDMITIIVCTASIVATILGAMSSIKSDIRDIKSDGRIYELKIVTIETTLKALQVQIDAIRNDVYVNRMNIQQNIKPTGN